MGGLEPRTGRGARRKLSTGAVDKSPLGPGSKRIRPGLTSNPGLPRGQPGADKNVKRSGSKIGFGQNTSRGCGLRPYEVCLAAREGAARTSNAKRLVVAGRLGGGAPTTALAATRGSALPLRVPGSPRACLQRRYPQGASAGVERTALPGCRVRSPAEGCGGEQPLRQTALLRGAGRAAPAAKRALHWVPEGML